MAVTRPQGGNAYCEAAVMSDHPDNQGMALRLAAAVADAQASPDSEMVAAGLFAVAASIDRLTGTFETLAEQLRDAAAKAGKGPSP
jgi:hypothetical protein